jgi:DNA invertase Pin-like site-specific DNA recombinase
MIGYIWARESNQDDEEIYSIKSQLDACREAAERDGVPVTPDREFSVQFSGRDFDAIPEMRRLRSALERNSHERQVVYCYAQDRLIRGVDAAEGGAIDIFYLIVEFRRFNAEVKFIRNPVDTRSLFGQVMLLFGGHKSSTEIDDIRDRTMRGKIRRMKEGKIPNYGLEKFGYRRVKETGKAEVHPEEWAVLHRIKRLYFEERRSASEVAELFDREGVPTPMKSKRGQNSRWRASTITRMLRDEAYKGLGVALRYKSKGYNTRNVVIRPREEWIEIPDVYPPLFTPEEWDRLQALIDSNINTGGRRRDGKTPGALRGLVVCEMCGRKLYPKWTSWMRVGGSEMRYLYYCCDVGARKDGGHPGYHNRVRLDALDGWAWEQFAAWLRGESFADDLRHFQQDGLANRLKAEADEAAREIVAKERQITNLLGQTREASPAVAKHLHAEIERVESERAAIIKRKREIEKHLADEASRDNLISELLEIRDEIVSDLDSHDEQGRREILQIFYVKVFVGGKGREKWRFTSLVVADTRSSSSSARNPPAETRPPA